jgi:hypothetical protein
MDELIKNGHNKNHIIVEENESAAIVPGEKKLDKNRDSKGRFVSGNNANPNGRPKIGETIVEEFRENPKGVELINRIFEIASTLGQKGQHKDAMTCAKLVIERLVPSLKSSELKLGVDENKGFVILPPQEKPKIEE